jgi:hypothetical protein
MYCLYFSIFFPDDHYSGLLNQAGYPETALLPVLVVQPILPDRCPFGLNQASGGDFVRL